MRNIMVPMLLLAAVALSTGVVLPRLPSLQPGPDPISDQSSSDTHSQVSECDVLRRLFRSEANWMFKTENSQEKYNDNFNKRQGVNMYDYEPMADEWISYQNQYYQPQDLEMEYLYDGDSYAHNQAQKWGSETPPLPTVNAIYSQNKDILVRDGHTYYLYDTIMAATSPFDYAQNGHNCLYNAMLRSTSNNAQPTDGNSLELQKERERLNTNEVDPIAEIVADKRDDVEDIGEKEMPDDQIVNEGDTGMVQKKLFSFWSRLQALSHKGRQLPTRRHTFVFYGPDGTRDGPLTAETRASHLRPPGQPLRWG